MGSRILTLQRQVREIGRLRTGYSTTETSAAGKEYQKGQKSQTWIVTSSQQDAVEVAADIWGGTVEQWQPQGAGSKQWRVITQASVIDAILPPGDPISQSYEMWDRGGCQVRCDGETATNPAGQRAPCLCLAKYGEQFYRRKPIEVCRPHTRLNVILPDLPDLGVFRLDTQGYYAASDLPAQVDLIRAAVGDRMVPISLRIIPLTRVREGKTLQSQTIALSIRGAVAAQLLAGQVPTVQALAPAQQPPALGASPSSPIGPSFPSDPGYAEAEAGRQSNSTDDDKAWLSEIAQAHTIDHLRGIWKSAAHQKALTETVKAAFWACKAELDREQAGRDARTLGTFEADTDEQEAQQIADGEPEPDRVQTWAQIVSEAGVRGMTTDRLTGAFKDLVGIDHYDADGWAMDAFLNLLREDKVT